MNKKITKLVSSLVSEIEKVASDSDRISILNEVRLALSECSPLKGHPVDCVVWVASENVEGNDYNPNSVAPPEQRLLETSILEDGYTMPIVGYRPTDEEREDGNITVDHVIVDGFHRRKSERSNKDISASTFGYVPMSLIRAEKTGRQSRIASTIRHNRARGSHSIEVMKDITAELVEAGMGDHWIMKHIGMDKDELLRLKQISGLAALFMDVDFTNGWSADDPAPDEESELYLSESDFEEEAV